EPSIDKGYLVLTATHVELREGEEGELPVPSDIDVTALVDLTTFAAHSCVASLLPKSISLTSLTVEGDAVWVTAEGHGVPTDFDALSAKGSCATVVPESGEGPQGDEPAAYYNRVPGSLPCPPDIFSSNDQ